MLEIYVQEVSALNVMMDLSDAQRQKVARFAAAAPELLRASLSS